MHSKIVMTALFATALVSCGQYEETKDSASTRVLQVPTFYSPASAVGIGQGNKAVILDRETNSLHQFGVNPFTLTSSVAIPFNNEKQWVLGGSDGSYSIVVSGPDYVIIKADGGTIKNPAQLQGEIQNVAYSPTGHLLVLMDEYLTMGVIKLSSAGDVERTFLGGPNLGRTEAIIAGTMLGKNKLLVSQGVKTLSVVDLEATLAAQSWKLTSFEVADAKAMTAMTAVPSSDSSAVVKDGERLFVIDTNTQAFVGTPIDISGRFLQTQSFEGVPHFITLDSQSSSAAPLQIHYIDQAGGLVTSSLQVKSTSIARSMLDGNREKLTLVFSSDTSTFDSSYHTKTEVLRYRLTDGLLLDKSEVEQSRKFVLLENYMILKSPSIIGLVERRTYGREPDVLQITKHNLPFLKNK